MLVLTAGYGGYFGSPAPPTASPVSYGSYGSPPTSGYYSVAAVMPTLFGNGRSLLSAMPDESVMRSSSGLDHFGSAFPSDTWQFLHHKSPAGELHLLPSGES